eukprot:4645072-Pleurochrysis_carterae.AAC.1
MSRLPTRLTCPWSARLGEYEINGFFWQVAGWAAAYPIGSQVKVQRKRQVDEKVRQKGGQQTWYVGE